MRAVTYAIIGAVIGAGALGTAGAALADDMHGMSMPAAAKHGQGKGVIKAIDPRAGTLIIQHGPIAAVGWPPMTMAFKARPARLLTGLKVGQTIGFDATVRGMSAEITAVRPQ